MISTDYQNLADYCAGFAKRQEPIPPRTAAVLAQAMLDLADQVKRLERSTLKLEPECCRD